MSRFDAAIEDAEKKLIEARKTKAEHAAREVLYVTGACFGWKHDGDFESADKILELLPANRYGNKQAITEHLWFSPQDYIKEKPDIVDVGLSVQHEYINGYGYLSHNNAPITEQEYEALRAKILKVIRP